MKERGNLFGFDQVVGGEPVRKRWTQEGFSPVGKEGNLYLHFTELFLSWNSRKARV